MFFSSGPGKAVCVRVPSSVRRSQQEFLVKILQQNTLMEDEQPKGITKGRYTDTGAPRGTSRGQYTSSSTTVKIFMSSFDLVLKKVLTTAHRRHFLPLPPDHPTSTSSLTLNTNSSTTSLSPNTTPPPPSLLPPPAPPRGVRWKRQGVCARPERSREREGREAGRGVARAEEFGTEQKGGAS